MSIKRLKDKYFVEEDDGLRINKKACKDDAQAAAMDILVLTCLVAGGLAMIGLATIGVRTIRLGANTLREGATIVTSQFRK